MGHYQYIKFDARLTEKGAEIIKTFYDTYGGTSWYDGLARESWHKTADMFTEYQFVETMLDHPQLDSFGVWTNTKGTAGLVFNFEARTWSIDCEFKWSGFDGNCLCQKFLPFIIAELLLVKLDHDLWEHSHEVTVSPQPLPKPDWYRKIGQPHDP